MTVVKRFILFVTIGLILFAAAWYFITPRFIQAPNNTKALSDFSLIDTNNKVFDKQALRGHWTLLFFGYPQCPDICPKTLDTMRDAWKIYEAQSRSIPVKFVFVNIDFTNASSNTVKAFINNYHQDFLGVTGSAAEITKLSGQLGIFSYQQNGKIDHTTALMLINPQAKLVAVFSQPFTAQDIVKDLDKAIM